MDFPILSFLVIDVMSFLLDGLVVRYDYNSFKVIYAVVSVAKIYDVLFPMRQWHC